MGKIWILVANSSKATLISADSPTAPLKELETFDNPDAREKISDLISDRQGRSFNSQGEGRHAMEVQIDPKEQEQIRFAKLISERLDEGRVANEFERLVVVAAPAFLGQLRSHFGKHISALVSLEVDKDYTSLPLRELRTRLPELL